jgi:hypothetical protein
MPPALVGITTILEWVISLIRANSTPSTLQGALIGAVSGLSVYSIYLALPEEVQRMVSRAYRRRIYCNTEK